MVGTADIVLIREVSFILNDLYREVPLYISVLATGPSLLAVYVCCVIRFTQFRSTHRAVYKSTSKLGTLLYTGQLAGS